LQTKKFEILYIFGGGEGGEKNRGGKKRGNSVCWKLRSGGLKTKKGDDWKEKKIAAGRGKGAGGNAISFHLFGKGRD